MEIRDLADCPEHLPTLAEWFHAEWGHIVAGGTTEGFTERLRTHLNRDALPLALVATDGDAAVGTASLRAAEMASRPELTPWLGGMYVRPDARGRGVGEALVRATEARAREMGFREVYLFATDREAWYRGLGWSVLGPAEHHGERCVLMRTELQDAPGGSMSELLSRITTHPEQCGGRPCIRSMRIRVADVLDLLAAGLSAEQVLAELPDLEMEDVRAALLFASRTLSAAS